MTCDTSSFSNWLRTPSQDHLVQFYKYESILLDSMSAYVNAGINNGDTCIIIATEEHIKKLNKDINVDKAYESGQYVTFDAGAMLASFMHDGMPNKDKFLQNVGSILQEQIDKKRPVRAYGEMVALLWKDGNRDALLTLENYWNELAQTYPFSLYCAYPELRSFLPQDWRNDVNHCHDLQVSPSVAAVTR